MALAKEQSISQDAHLGSSQSYTHFGSTYGGPSIQVSDPSLGMFAIESNHRLALEKGDGLEKTVGSSKNLTTNHTSLSELHNMEVPGGFMLGAINSLPPLVESQSLLNFKTGPDHWDYSSGSLLSFEQGDQLSHAVYPKNGHEDDDYSIWENAVDHSEECNQSNLQCGSEACLVDDVNCCEATGVYGQINGAHKDGQHGEVQPGWLYSGAIAGDGFQGSGGFDECRNKRPYQGDHDIQALKKHCSSPPKKAKPKPVPSKDPQSIAAKNRRERISERLKILQDLVPNGTKVDLVTMLEKAISYVKFLQLQVKVLATDEFWPAQGGKAPEISQVREAIDAILSSHRETSAISSK